MLSSRKRTLCLFGLAGLLTASGCVDSEDPAFTVFWDLAYVGDDRSVVSCANAGTPTVELTMINQRTQRRAVNTFNCDSGGGQSDRLPAGVYDVKIALKNQAGVEISNDAGVWTLVRDTLTDLGDITFPIQSFHLSWTLARGPMSLACRDVDAKTVNIVSRLNSEPEVVYSFPCEAGAGSTQAILLGTYSVRLQLLNSAGTVIWDTDMPMTIPVNERERAVLPPVVFNL